MTARPPFAVLLLVTVISIGAFATPGEHRASATSFSVTRLDDPEPDGCTAADCSLREAVIAANSQPGPDVITLSKGTYVLTISGPGEDGAATGDLDIRDHLTLSGEGQTATIIDGNGLDRVLQVGSPAAASITVDIEDLAIQHGHAAFSFGPESGSGGGILIRPDTRLTLTRTTVADSRGDTFGGGIYSEAGSLTLVDSALTGNHEGIPGGLGGVGGGGLYSTGTATLQRTIISDNASEYGTGGISNADGLMTLSDSQVVNNTGGGILNGGELELHRTIVRANSAYSGAGIEGGGDGITISDSTISDNIAQEEAGGIRFGGDPGVVLTIVNSVITGNQAGTRAGGVLNWVGGTVNLTNSTVSGNNAEDAGGGIYVESGALTVTNGTITDNTSTAAIYNGSGSASLVNTIVANNVGGDNCTGVITSQGHNLDDGSTCAFLSPGDLADTDPKLGPLQDNGGFTHTHALLAGSAATDAGDDVACPATDQRGSPRPVDGNGDGTATCDIGAFEFAPPPTPTSTPTQQHTPTPTSTPSRPIGDANCDGTVNAIDAALVLQYSAGLLSSLPCEADANQDGVIDPVDAALLLQLVAGLIDSLPP